MSTIGDYVNSSQHPNCAFWPFFDEMSQMILDTSRTFAFPKRDFLTLTMDT